MFYRLPFCLPVGFSSQLAEGIMIVGGHSQLSGLTRAAVDSWELITSPPFSAVDGIAVSALSTNSTLHAGHGPNACCHQGGEMDSGGDTWDDGSGLVELCC